MVSIEQPIDAEREVREATTYCRLCEPLCGLIATVEDGRIVKVRGDKEHVFSQGFLCAKAQGYVEITYDPDRVTQPLRRVGGPGEFEPCSWDEALDAVADGLTSVRARYGAPAVATMHGNPLTFSFGAATFLTGFKVALEVKRAYGIASDDGASRMGAVKLLYGPGNYPIPDLWRTHFVLALGTNPLVSKGARCSEPRMREALDSVLERDGRVVIVDPRRTETARRYEHVPVRPGTDAWFLLGILHVLFSEGLEDRAFLDRHTTGLEELRRTVATFDLDVCAAQCRVSAETIRDLARQLAAAPSAVVFGATGTCTQRFGTLNNLLQDLVVAVTGNLDREGGMVLAAGVFDISKYFELMYASGRAEVRTRVHELPGTEGQLPSAGLAPDITVPGEEQIRAVVNVASNMVLTSGAGGGPELADALQQLELFVALDLYVNETNRYAHFILPCTGNYERDDFPLTSQVTGMRPAVWATEAVIDPVGDTRHDWWILNEIARRMGLGGAYSSPELRERSGNGDVVTPMEMLDKMLENSTRPDLTFETLVRDHPHGLSLRPDLPVGNLLGRLRTEDGKIPLACPTLIAEAERLREHIDDPSYPFRVIGMREVRSMNSWMHNVPHLMPDGRLFGARINPADAAAVGIADGDMAEISSKKSSITVRAIVTDDVGPGTIAIPHGWGHHGGGRRANSAGGVSSNLLTSHDLEDIEPIAGMSILNGVPVRLASASAQIST